MSRDTRNVVVALLLMVAILAAVWISYNFGNFVGRH